MDAILHAQRLASAPTALRPPVSDPAMLPDGAMLAEGRRAFAMRDGRLLPWNFDGYGSPVSAEEVFGHSPPRLLTPPSTVAALHAGYAPVWHGTANCIRTSRP
jgi:hypothetical protein